MNLVCWRPVMEHVYKDMHFFTLPTLQLGAFLCPIALSRPVLVPSGEIWHPYTSVQMLMLKVFLLAFAKICFIIRCSLIVNLTM